jgi:hypothetical protein
MTQLHIARLAIIGSRTIDPDTAMDPVFDALLEFVDVPTLQAIVSGGKRKDGMGADTLADHIALRLTLPIRHHYPDWNAHGKAAGPLRNTLIAEDADACLALLDKPLEQSRGTFDTVTKFRKLGKDVKILELKA